MTREQADKFMNEQFDKFANKARTAESAEEQVHYTDAAHKLYITLASAGAFEQGSENVFGAPESGSGPS